MEKYTMSLLKDQTPQRDATALELEKYDNKARELINQLDTTGAFDVLPTRITSSFLSALTAPVIIGTIRPSPVSAPIGHAVIFTVW